MITYNHRFFTKIVFFLCILLGVSIIFVATAQFEEIREFLDILQELEDSQAALETARKNLKSVQDRGLTGYVSEGVSEGAEIGFEHGRLTGKPVQSTIIGTVGGGIVGAIQYRRDLKSATDAVKEAEARLARAQQRYRDFLDALPPVDNQDNNNDGGTNDGGTNDGGTNDGGTNDGGTNDGGQSGSNLIGTSSDLTPSCSDCTDGDPNCPNASIHYLDGF